MDKQSYKLAKEFFRSEIKALAEDIKHNKYAYRENQRRSSKGETQRVPFKGNCSKSYYIEHQMECDKFYITALHIAYANLRGKKHVKEDREDVYSSDVQACNERMEEYIKANKVVEPEMASSTGG